MQQTHVLADGSCSRAAALTYSSLRCVRLRWHLWFIHCQLETRHATYGYRT